MSFAFIKTGNSPLAYRITEIPVFFADENSLKTIEAILDEKGNFRNFPGAADDERWTSKMHIGFREDVRFEASFYHMENGEHLMLWIVQPSGWEWVDEDGFGFSGDPVITLYSVINRDGNFTDEFCLFSIDSERFCHDFDNYL